METKLELISEPMPGLNRDPLASTHGTPRLSKSVVVTFFFSFSLFFTFFFSPLKASLNASPQEITVDDLEKNAKSGEFPSGWKTYPFQFGKAKQVYQVAVESEGRWIRAKDDQDISMPIFKDFSWPLDDYPEIKWRWRALELPSGAHEDDRSTNDSACGVYVAFGKMSGVALKYVWSSTLPVGHVWTKDPGKFYVIVKASGKSGLNQWQSEKVNVIEDYKKYFGKDPKKDPSGIGIMTDGNAMHTSAACDYGGFVILKK